MEAVAARRADALELRDLSKAFGPVRAVSAVSLKISAGSITGIIGENGAGKSTLMNLVYGLVAADSGAILVAGREVAIAGPQDAIRLGIGMVHQHFMLVDTFTVLENVVLGAEEGLLTAAGLAAGRAKLATLAERFGLRIEIDAIVGDLSVGDQQRVEILKALVRGARVLILDEPTAVLTPQEADRLFAILRELAADGVAIVLVTHKLREIMAITDRVHVLRGGVLVASLDTASTQPAELAELMIGGSLPVVPARVAAPLGEVRLEARRLCVADPATRRLLVKDVDLVLRGGEIVGVAGVSGNGQVELMEALAGMRPLARGSLRIGEREVTPARPADPRVMRELGVAHVPEHRHRHGMVADFAASESAILGQQARSDFGGVVLDPAVVERHCATLMKRLDVRPPSPRLAAGRFSGGNQQKLVVAREVESDPRVLLVGQPTRGVDIGAIATIHREIRALRDAGCAILVVSAELDEIVTLADRILVMLGGRLVGEVAGHEADPTTLGLMMSGEAGAVTETHPAAERAA